jgi:site-specific recombinase XerD
MKYQKYISEFENYLISNNSSNATVKSYTRTITQLLRFLNKYPDDVVEKDIEKYKLYAIQVKQYDINTLIPKYSAINSFMEFLNKPITLKPPKKRVKNKIPLTIEEIKQLFQSSEDDFRDNAIFKVLYYGQLRRSELANLNVEDIDFERQKIRINHGKGNQYDEINIHPDALKSTANYLKVRELPLVGHENALFLSRERKRIGRTDIHTTIKKYAYKTGIKKRVYPHLFRISSITHMAEKGLNLEEIRMQSRHKRYDTLQSYVQMSDNHIKKVYMNSMNLYSDSEKHKTETESKTNNYNISNIQIQLAEKLARGEITQEVYLQVIRSLKNSSETEGAYSYQ